VIRPSSGAISATSNQIRVSLATGAALYLPSLRTDAVNRGFCISLLTSEMIFLAISNRILLFFFFFIE
jgi:hypothetical protein